MIERIEPRAAQAAKMVDAWAWETAYDLEPTLRWLERWFVTDGALITEKTCSSIAQILDGLSATSAAPALVIVEPDICDQKTANELLFELRRLSGLSWDQIAELCGVSRRSVHFWASGKPISKSNHRRLGSLVSVMRHVDRGYGELNQQLLLAPGDGGRTLLELLAAEEFELARSLAGAGPGRPGALPASEDPAPDHTPFGASLAEAEDRAPSDTDIYVADQPATRRAKPRRK